MWKLLFGKRKTHCYENGTKHNFVPRYTTYVKNEHVKLLAEKIKNSLTYTTIDITIPTEIEHSDIKVYIGDVCTWCGKFIPNKKHLKKHNFKIVKKFRPCDIKDNYLKIYHKNKKHPKTIKLYDFERNDLSKSLKGLIQMHAPNEISIALPSDLIKDKEYTIIVYFNKYGSN